MKYCSFCGSPVDSIFIDKCEHCGEDLVIENDSSSNINKSKSYNLNNNKDYSSSKSNIYSRYSKYKEVYDENNNLLYKEVQSFDDIENITFKSLFKKDKTFKQYSDVKSRNNQDIKSDKHQYINSSKNSSSTYSNSYNNYLPNALISFFSNLNATSKSSFWYKNKYIAAFISIFFGIFGAQKFYLGKYKIGIIYLILSFTGIIGVIELISLIEGFIYLFTPEEQFIQKYL
ncbi:TM2 domain-containing protein [Clostridium sp. D46t1_190503_E9]|uniref:TM2 domain-containing protein n=1 Tax=Clostridium sp. D46t1_190503_E9 TaxID=2787137 RepID=UPI0018995BF8|nr:TM2 domain-containing protein [Clostridium sp. D46t1_190503_E9]